MSELTECEARVKYWTIATARAEWAWINHQGDPWEKERRRRAYEFADRLLLGWERRLEGARSRVTGVPLLRLVPRSA